MIVSAEEIATRMRRTFDESTLLAVNTFLQHTQAQLGIWLSRQIEIEEFTETIWPEMLASAEAVSSTPQRYERIKGREIFLKNTPVQSVSRVILDDDEQPPTAYEVHTWGIRLRVIFMQLAPHSRPVSITYTAGLSGDKLETVKGVLTSAAVRRAHLILEDSQGLESMSTENYSAGQIPDILTEGELASLKPVKRKMVST